MGKDMWIALVILLALAGSVFPECPHTVMPAHMCLDSQISGSSVYIDTSAAAGTQDLLEVVCTCTATIAQAKLVTLNVTQQNSKCGSKLSFKFSSVDGALETSDCISTSKLSVQKPEEVQIDLHKTKSPFGSDYCIQMKIEMCGADQYQCDKTGTCIDKADVCNGMPQCLHDDDEANCGVKGCAEGGHRCKSGECYEAGTQCDGTEDCLDGSDEYGCGGNTSAVSTTKAPVLDPIITVKCFKSTKFTTTTTTSTTTTTTTTTTTSTTTTTPTTTTTESTTTTPSPTTTIASTTPVSSSSPATEPPTRTSSTASLPDDTGGEAISSSSISTSAHIAQTMAPKTGTNSPLKRPEVLAGIVIGALAAIVITTVIIYAVHRKLTGSKSKDITNPSELWIQNKEERELEPLNSPL